MPKLDEECSWEIGEMGNRLADAERRLAIIAEIIERAAADCRFSRELSRSRQTTEMSFGEISQILRLAKGE